jgi:hypothetical protein
MGEKSTHTHTHTHKHTHTLTNTHKYTHTTHTHIHEPYKVNIYLNYKGFTDKARSTSRTPLRVVRR